MFFVLYLKQLNSLAAVRSRVSCGLFNHGECYDDGTMTIACPPLIQQDRVKHTVTSVAVAWCWQGPPSLLARLG